MPKIKMNQVESSNVHSIGYDPVQQTLAVRFYRGDKAGPLYHYHGVPAEVHASLVAPGASVGGMIAKAVKHAYQAELQDD